MAINVKLADDLVEDAKRIAAVEHRSVPKQIEFYFRLALVAEQNPDMSFKLIKELLRAKVETDLQKYEFSE